MSQFCTPFDPHAQASGTLVTQLGKDEGVLLILNDSATNVLFTLSDGQRKFSPAQAWRRIDVPPGNDSISWQQQSMLSVGVPNSQVYCESFAASEDIPEVFPASLVRGVIGSNTVANQLVNQGNSQGTNVINTSSSPGAGSLNFNNDGSGTIKLLDNGSVLNIVNFLNGTNITPWSVQFGNAAELVNTHFYGEATLQTLDVQTLGNIGGIATNGSMFAAVISSLRQHVAVNTATTIITISAPITGTYRVNGMVDKGNATASAITFNVSWTAPITGVQTRNFSCDNAGAYLNLRGTTTVGSTVLPCFPIVFDATVSTTISVSFTDPTGTANDNVTAILECFV